ncbi:hypothetical protein NUU61_001903 [Penicillium alfredii]|uniref:DUF4440 domain-containing protein n=1 Tax=Penicillium alfredii TaxID=1506179 RepID=A0A9W9FQH3_9EURO|nr:uncharacterized protein NUU61_001903 [Penicillium alfredii]KAJ5104556.1 hypothetical protein NUU61_001903 [Penicillium alfredii]
MDPSEIRTYETKAWNALCHSGPSLLPLLAKDCIMLFPGGMMLSDKTLRSTLTGDMFQPWESYTICEDRVVPLDANGRVALVVYKVTAERDDVNGGDTVAFRALCSSIWRQRAGDRGLGGWEMVSHQQTPVLDTPW